MLTVIISGRSRCWVALLLAGFLGTALPGPPASADGGASRWVYPVIPGYGGVRPRPDLPASIVPQADYKVIADVTHGETDPSQVNGSLQRLARLINLMAYAGAPREHVHVAAVIEGGAVYAAFTNVAYRERFKVDNPNLALLHELRAAGVELMVCAQALAENDLPDAVVSADVSVTLSALTDFAVYGQRGYSYLQL